MSLFSLTVKAGEAFGSGGHPSTQGALMALEGLKSKSIRTVLDIGCGSGVLALTAAHVWQGARVLAADIAPEAVDFTLENAKENGMKSHIRAVRADGYRHPDIKAGAPYDLVLCNVLAEVIVRISVDLAKHQRKGGIAILSGILTWHEQTVRDAHEAIGYRVLDMIAIQDWRTLVLEKD